MNCILLSIALLSEVVRKYFFVNNVIFLFSDVLMILIGIYVIFSMRTSVNWWYCIILMCYFFWGAFPYFFNNRSVILIVVGMRPFVIALMYYAISFKIAENDGLNSFFKFAIFWSMVMGVVSILQLALGKEHWINLLPGDKGNEVQGIGDYTIDGKSIAGLFRPTSIFMHTGKFGQAFFVLAVSIITKLSFMKKMTVFGYVALLFVVIVVFITGQRSAMVLFFLFGMYVLVLNKKIDLKFFSFVFVLSCIVMIYIPMEYVEFPVERALSGVFGAKERFSGTMSNAWSVLDSYWLSGEGLGFFTFGSSSYGGTIIYKFDPRFRSTENTWLRIIGETGVIGVLLIMICFLYIILRMRYIAKNVEKKDKWVAYTAMFCASGFSVWGITHDIIGNYLTMSLLFTFVGASEGIYKKMNNYDK